MSRKLPTSAITVLSFVTLHTHRGQFDWQNLVFMNMHEAQETNLLPMGSYVSNKKIFNNNDAILRFSYLKQKPTYILNGKPNLKPLSHQSGVLTAFPKRLKNCRSPRCTLRKYILYILQIRQIQIKNSKQVNIEFIPKLYVTF